MGSPADTVQQLNAARDIVLRDPALYPQVVPGVLPVVGAAAELPVRRWGSDFLAETFASPVVSAEVKQKMCVSTGLLDTLRGYLNRKEDFGSVEDSSVVKAAVQCAASVYPLVFRHAISNPSDGETWGKMAAIKSSILRKMDFLPAGVRMCCIKFLAVVVQVQTPGLIADPRRPEQNEISLALLPRDHPVLKVGNLEAEASGILDRLLSVLEEDGNDAILVTATINALSSPVHRRASISNKILSTIMAFNPLKLVKRPCTGRERVNIKSMTRTTTSFLLNVLKRNPQHNLAGRIQQHIDRLRHGLGEAFLDINQLKRAAPDEPTDGLDDVKRQRVEGSAINGTAIQQQPAVPAQLPPGPVTAAQLFTLTDNKLAQSFHVETLPPQIVAQLVPALFASIDPSTLDKAINVVRARYIEVISRPRVGPTDLARAVTGDEDDDYDPAADYEGETERVMNELDRIPSQNIIDHNIKIGPFHLPPPPPLSQGEATEQSKLALIRLFGVLAERDREVREKGAKSQETAKGFNRPGTSPQTREGWMKLIIRIATRADYDMPEANQHIKLENGEGALSKRGRGFTLADGIRDALFDYVMEDFRRRINDAITWLNEEWFCERIKAQQNHDAGGIVTDTSSSTPRYTYWTLKFLDAIVPYLDTKDNRILIRFYSEIPRLDAEALDRLVKVAEDPERVNLAVQTLLYLVMFRKPVRESALDALERLWKDNEDARKPAERHLVKWRPGIIQNQASPQIKTEA